MAPTENMNTDLLLVWRNGTFYDWRIEIVQKWVLCPFSVFGSYTSVRKNYNRPPCNVLPKNSSSCSCDWLHVTELTDRYVHGTESTGHWGWLGVSPVIMVRLDYNMIAVWLPVAIVVPVEKWLNDLCLWRWIVQWVILFSMRNMQARWSMFLCKNSTRTG